MTTLGSFLQETLALLRRLAVNEPWSLSTEGLDDCCIFCHSEARNWTSADGYRYLHEVDCAWMEAREFLELEQPRHKRKYD